MYKICEVYGIRQLSLDEIRHWIFVEYDASRLHPKMWGRCFEVQA
jgi:hypothetical protein